MRKQVLAGVLREVCQELAVSLYPSSGFSSDTLPYEASRAIAAAGKSAVILYVGDYDPAGVLIDQDIERKLRFHLGQDYPLEFNRLAVNLDQITTMDLPSKPRSKTERRCREITETVEAEAIPAGIMRQLVREAIEVYLPTEALESARLIDKAEQDSLLRMSPHFNI